jgi:hypothetical protein
MIPKLGRGKDAMTGKSISRNVPESSAEGWVAPHWFVKDGTTPSKAALFILNLAKKTLERSDDKQSLDVLAEIDAKKGSFTVAQAKKLIMRLNDSALRLPTDKVLKKRPVILSYVINSLVWCSAAVVEEEKGNETEAWKLIASSCLEIGTALAVGIERKKARKAAIARHEPDAENKKKVFNWLLENAAAFPRQMDKMAEHIEREGIVDNEYTTIRRWIREWNKTRSVSEKI